MRKPAAASSSSPLPTLAALLAGAAAAQGCAHIECGEARADEVLGHGQLGVDSARRGALREGLREVAVASGILSHRSTTLGVAIDDMPRPGARMPVAPDPPPIAADGGVAEVTPVPPQPPSPPRPVVRTAGAPMRVTPSREVRGQR